MNYPGLRNQPDNGVSRGRLFRAVRRFLRAQFGRPTGPLGYLSGKIMARSASNRARIEWTLSLLDVKQGDRVLEIGMGPGVAIERLTKIATEGVIAGVDHSAVMVRQARKRNARALTDGRADLRLGSASDLPSFGEPFDKILTINSIHFWNRPVDCLTELHGLLKPGGRIAVTLQPRSRRATHASTKEIGNELVANLRNAGFSEVRLEIDQIEPASVVCALGTK